MRTVDPPLGSGTTAVPDPSACRVTEPVRTRAFGARCVSRSVTGPSVVHVTVETWPGRNPARLMSIASADTLLVVRVNVGLAGGVAPMVQVWSSTAAGEGLPGTFADTRSDRVCDGSGRIPDVARTDAWDPAAAFR